jgi:hypothetical protein
LFIPFQGVPVLVEVRYPTGKQNPAREKIQLIEDITDKKKLSNRDIVELNNLMEECARATLNRPTLEELEKEVHGRDHVLAYRRKALADMKTRLAGGNVTDGERRELTLEIEKQEIFCGYVLPEDTMAALTRVALGVDITDIKKVTQENLLLAYQKAKLYGGDPATYIAGLFTVDDKAEISTRATLVGAQWEEAQHRKKGRRK